MIEVRAPGESMSTVHVGSLNVAGAAPFGNDSGVVRALHRNMPAAVYIVVNIDAALRSRTPLALPLGRFWTALPFFSRDC